jgi:GWxTD domain-containing protein
VVWFLTLLIGCAGGGGRPPADASLTSPLEAFVTTRMDSDGRELPEVEVSLPYRSLVFRREGAEYLAGITVTVVAFRGSERVGGGVNHATVRVPDFEDTKSQRTLGCRVSVPVRGEDDVRLEVEVQVDETSRRWQRDLLYQPQDNRAIPVYFADFRWNLVGEPSGATLGIAVDSLRVHVSLGRRQHADRWPPGGVMLVARIEGGYKGQMIVARQDVLPETVGSPESDHLLIWSARELPFGELTLHLDLEGELEEGKANLTFDPAHRFANLRVPWWDDREWRRHVAWLDGLLEGDQRELLAATVRDQRSKRWRETWQAVGTARARPAAQAERSHMMRIVEADAKFTVYGRGALTDRGRLYVRLGPPDQVQTQHAENSEEGRWEIWYYHEAQMQYTFYDPHGMGDYHLYSSSSL